MNTARESRKVVVVGAGDVGATFAYALLQSGTAESIVLIDARKAQAEGQASDLAHGLPFVPSTVVRAGSANDYADATAIVITAGAKQKTGESRLDLLRRNILIMNSIKDVCLSVPCIVSQAGIERIIVGKLTDEEQRDLTGSAMVLKKTLADLAIGDGERKETQKGL